jgi:hypothetical protein
MGVRDSSNLSATEDEFGGFRITIPVTPKWFLRLFLPVWLCGWLAGEVVVSMALVSGKPQGFAVIFLLFWLCGWTAGGMLAILSLAWNWAGREVVIIADGWMAIRREITGFGRSKSFEVSRMRNLRFSPLAYNAFAGGRRATLEGWGLGAGWIAFDYDEGPERGTKTHRFGGHLPEFESGRVIATIRERFKIPEGPVPEPLPISIQR